MVDPKRAAICQAVSEKLAKADASCIGAVVGLDGFVDEIAQVVDKRASAGEFERIATIDRFARRIAEAAGQSANIELVVKLQKLGGNGPIMANALATMGLAVTYIGNLGYPDLHPVFHDLAKKASIFSIAEPCHTDALEFDDGKLMLGKLTPTAEITWENIAARVGVDELVSLVASVRLLGLVNWTMLPYMNSIWKHLAEDVLPDIPAKDRILFVDLADPEKRTREDLHAGLKILEIFKPFVHVILGLNLKEAVQVADVLNIALSADPEKEIEPLAEQIRARLELGTVVIHPRAGAAAADAQGAAFFAGPFVKHPKISTGAGDHFNAGFVAGRLLGLNLAEALCMGTATSGFYVRSAASPTLRDLAEFIRDLPAPQ
ncbi:MAG: PfkB family carbohydrate kinase [Phycisphaerae bacterium]